jgi:predicted XRE-type DNA-binding protein
MEYFHISYPSVDFLVGRLQTLITGWRADVHGEAAEALVTKIEILNRVLSWLNGEVLELIDYLKTVPYVAEKCISNRLAIYIPRHHHDLLWQLSADVEAFLIEARPVYELRGKFLRHFFLLIFQREVTQKDIISAVRELGVDVSWFSVLKDNRDLFVHSAASLPAVEP